MWKHSFVAVFCVGFIVSGALAQYTVPQDPNVEVSVEESVQASSASLIFNGDNVIVDPGQRLQLDCGVEGEYRSCFWEKAGDQTKTFQVEDVYEKFVNGLSKPENVKGNECGIVINSVSAKDHGKWTCKVFVIAATLEGAKNVIVTVKPQQPSLDINENPVVVAENDEREVSCTVAAARPAARIRWFVGTEDVTVSSQTENIPTDDQGTYRSVSTLKYRFHHLDDRKGLRCSIEHQTLQEPEYAEIPLDVRYAPYPISSTRIYGIPMDKSEYEIKFNFTSNPSPEMSWHINELEIPVPAETGRYKTSIRSLMDNIYMAALRIRDFNSEDLGVTYRLMTKNNLGEKNFEISLSSGPAPPDGDSEVSSDEIIASPDQFEPEDSIGSGTVAAIIVIVVFILILLFIIGMMRYRQMYCFGPKDRITNHLKESGENLKEEHSDTESAREPKGKASNLIKNFTSLIKPKKGQKEPRLDKIEEGEAKDEKGSREICEGKSNNPSEIVYAELELNKSEKEKRSKNGSTNPETTEYAEIVGTIPDNRNQERKE